VRNALAVGGLALAWALAGPALADAPVVDIDQAGAVKFPIRADWLAAGGGSVWATDPAGTQIRRIDPATGQVASVVQVAQEACEAPDYGLDALWTATCLRAGVARIDPSTNAVAGFVRLRIPRLNEGEASIGVGAGAVWVVVDGKRCRACVVARITPGPRLLRVVKRIPIRSRAAAVRFGEGAVWVTNPQRSLVQKIDPSRNRVVATAKVGLGPRFFAVGEGGVWTLNQVKGTVTRLDPTTGRVVATIDVGFNGEGGDMAAGGGWIWARSGNDVLLAQIDPRTNTVVRKYGPAVGSGAAIVNGNSVWVSAHDVSTVWRLPLPSG
jgi:virginiamycin B lyase